MRMNKVDMKNILRIHVTAVLALAACFAIFACTRTDQPPSGPSEKVTIAYALLPDSALDQIAASNKYYSQEGLEVIRQPHQIGKQALQSVIDGKADFATVAETPVIFSIMSGEKISVIAEIDASHRNMALIARKDMGITKLEDLKGRKIAATFGTISEFFMDSILTVNGISRREIAVENLPPDKLLPAIEEGEVDAISIWNPLLINIQKRLGDKGLTVHGEDLYTQFFVVVARQDFIKANPQVVKKILRALIHAEEFTERHPAEAQKIVAQTTNTDAVFISEIWSNNNFKLNLDQSLILALEDESRWAIKNKLTTAERVPNYLDFIYFDGLKSVKPDTVRILK